MMPSTPTMLKRSVTTINHTEQTTAHSAEYLTAIRTAHKNRVVDHHGVPRAKWWGALCWPCR